MLSYHKQYHTKQINMILWHLRQANINCMIFKFYVLCILKAKVDLQLERLSIQNSCMHWNVKKAKTNANERQLNN